MKRRALKKKGIVSHPKIHKRDDLDHWRMLEAASKQDRVPSVNGKTIAGSIVRTHALEWLRLESIRLAYKRSPEWFLRIAEEQDPDIRHAFGKDRDKLIGWPPRPVTWCYPYKTPGLKAEFCIDVLAPEDIQVDRLKKEQRRGRVIISVDPTQSDLVLKTLRKYLAKHGMPGTGGRTCSLEKLREALLSYERWLDTVQPEQSSGAQVHEPGSLRNNRAMRDIGEKLKSCPLPSQKDPEGSKEKRAQKILECARQMLRTALEIQRKSKNGKEGSQDEELKPWVRQYR